MKMGVRLRGCIAVLAIVAGADAAAAAELEPVSVGGANSVSDAAIFIADKNGYLREEGISISFTSFTSATDALPSLAAGQLDVYGGSTGAAFFNAVSRDIKLRIVADKASSQKGYPVNRLLVRKDLVDSGRFKTLKDLKGMRIAMTGPGISNQVTLDDALKEGGLVFSDVETVALPFPQHVTAFANKGVDAGVTTEPSGTVAINQGFAVAVKGDDEIYPGHEIAVLMYSEPFAQARHDTAMRFMRAYLRGLRYYHDALKDGKLAGPNADKVIAILTESTPIKDAQTFRMIIPSGCDPDGRVNEASLKHDLAFYREQGLIEGDASVDRVVDYSFVDAALKQLGPYRPQQ